MSVKVIHEVQGDMPAFLFNVKEDCVFCGLATRWWWAGGCMTVCPTCAENKSHQECLETAKSEGYGPLPDWDTTVRN